MAKSISPSKVRRLMSGAFVAAVTAATITLGATSAHASSACTTLYDGHSGHADVCKNWYAVGGGYYRGDWRIRVTTSYTYVQAYEDGAVVNLSGSHGSFPRPLKRFYMRACSSFGGCSGWW